MSIEVIIPSRGRPDNIQRLLGAWRETVELPDTHLTVAVDDDDPTLEGYRAVHAAHPFAFDLVVGPRLRLAPLTNMLGVAAAEKYDVVGSIGDDHLPRTEGWDRRFADVLDEHPGVAYGDDLWQGENLPTAAFISSAVIRELGYVCPRTLVHLFIDNFWKLLGAATNLHYLPDIVIEHMHPHAGKAESDVTYEEANNQQAWSLDETNWRRFLAEEWPSDSARLGVFIRAASKSAEATRTAVALWAEWAGSGTPVEEFVASWSAGRRDEFRQLLEESWSLVLPPQWDVLARSYCTTYGATSALLEAAGDLADQLELEAVVSWETINRMHFPPAASPLIRRSASRVVSAVDAVLSAAIAVEAGLGLPATQALADATNRLSPDALRDAIVAVDEAAPKALPAMVQAACEGAHGYGPVADVFGDLGLDDYARAFRAAATE